MGQALFILDLIAVGVFAASGALVASRKQMDLIGFGLMAALTGIGGGTLRDLLIGRPVFWVSQPEPLYVCLGVALALFFTASSLQKRYQVLLWADAAGIALYGALGAELARGAGAGALVCLIMGMMTATFGGLIRDVVCRETPLILKKEVYATCALLAAVVHLAVYKATGSVEWALTGGIVAGFGLRAAGIIRGLSLPVYKGRPGRDY